MMTNEQAGDASIGRDGKTFPETTDALVWAKQFTKTTQAPDFKVPNLRDEGFLLGWFANAIEAGRSAGKRARSPIMEGDNLSGDDLAAIVAIVNERVRQKLPVDAKMPDRETKPGEGWTDDRDDGYFVGELSAAAASYAIASSLCATLAIEQSEAPPATWPWNSSWWKPSTKIRNLEKAGALIIAEIARLRREADREALMEAERERNPT
jgi:hypothetical protein